MCGGPSVLFAPLTRHGCRTWGSGVGPAAAESGRIAPAAQAGRGGRLRAGAWMAREQEQPSLGRIIRRYRIGAGLTQQDLARRAGLSVRALRDLEQDRVARPRAPSIHRLHAALGLS